MPRKTLILLGAGHAHLLVTERIGTLRAAGLEPLLVAPRRFHYSGLATAILSGALPIGANQIDVAALAARRGLAYREASATSIGDDHLLLDDGDRLDFDLLSINSGSDVASPLPGAWPAKPLDSLDRLRTDLEAHFARAAPVHIVVAGAGPTGTELAACLAGLAVRNHAAASLLLVGTPFSPRLCSHLEQRGIRHRDGKVVAFEKGFIRLDDGTETACTHLVAATGLAASPRAFPIDAALQAVGKPGQFAAGDCAYFRSRPLPKLGLFGVRQAPVLAYNLAAAATGAPLLSYRPQRRWLSILDLGDNSGFATWGSLSHHGPLALRWKRHLDQSFLARLEK